MAPCRVAAFTFYPSQLTLARSCGPNAQRSGACPAPPPTPPLPAPAAAVRHPLHRQVFACDGSVAATRSKLGGLILLLNVQARGPAQLTSSSK